ncbi:glycosyltransferase family 39 protein [bacterium]|nr:glycosyltransferase family 39 protein [bacterium]
MVVLILLPVITFFLIWVFMVSLLPEQNQPEFIWQDSLIKTALLWSALLTLSTELLSLFGTLTTGGVVTLWGLCLLALCVFLCRTERFSLGWSKIRITIFSSKMDWFGIASLTIIIIVLVILLITGLMSPPNIHDVLAYHMSRVMHWIQNQSLSFFPASTTWELWMPPFSEYSQLNWQLLVGNDLLSSFHQWYSLILTLVAVSAAAGQLGAKKRGQWLSALFVISLPVVTLQASGAKNDIVLAFFFGSLIYFITKISRNPIRIWDEISMGIAVGLGLLTKGNFPFFIFPVLLWLLILMLKRAGWKRTLAFLGLGLLIVTSLNAGHWIRNTMAFGGPYNTAGADFTLNQRFGLDVMVSNLSRNIVSQLLSVGFVNDALIEGLTRLHNWMGIPLFDQSITHGPAAFFDVPTREEIAGNPLHLLITSFVIVIILIGLFREKERSKLWKPLILGFTAFSGMAVFSGVFRWQVWGSRYFIPYYVMFAPVVGFVFNRRLPKWTSWLLSLVLILIVVNPLFNNFSRSFSWSTKNRNSIWRMSRKGLLFANQQAYEGAILKLTHEMEISDCRMFGMVIGAASPEYLVWATLSPTSADYTLEHVEVDNPSAMYARPDFDPCGVIVFETAPPVWLQDEAYQLVDRWEFVEGQGYQLSLYLLPDFIQ